MIVYHGSYQEVARPDLLHSRENVDFGVGFYTTPLYEQAVRWCAKFGRRGKAEIISKYNLDDVALRDLNVLKFDAYDAAWLDFVLTCRSGKDSSNYDIVIGGVADDKVFNTMELFFEGLIDRDEALGRLRYEQPNMQLCLRSDRAIDGYLHFKGSERL